MPRSARHKPRVQHRSEFAIAAGDVILAPREESSSTGPTSLGSTLDEHPRHDGLDETEAELVFDSNHLVAPGPAQGGAEDPTASSLGEVLLHTNVLAHPNENAAQPDCSDRLDIDGGTPTATNLIPMSSQPASRTIVPSNYSNYAPTMLKLQTFQKLLIAHGILVSIAFLVLLPCGALAAQFAGSLSPSRAQKWYRAHWIVHTSVGMLLFCPRVRV